LAFLFLTSMSIDFSLFGGADSLSEGKRTLRRTYVPGTENDHAARRDYAGPPQDPRDFLWLMTEEPHRTRRMEIMHAHPEVTKLMGHEPLTKYIVVAVVSLQIAAAVYFRHTHPLSPSFMACAYVLGGTANHNLFLAIHEITHNLAFQSVVMNRVLAVFANFPIGVPYAAAFKVSV
jgi:sphingolipid delta-4 desaturase